MSSTQHLDFFLSAHIRPFLYNKLASCLPSTYFDRVLAVFCRRNHRMRLEHIEGNLGQFLFDWRDKAAFLSVLTLQFPDETRKTLAHADRLVDHVFDLLGSGPVNLGPTINWHQDFKSGFMWNCKFHKDIQFVRLNDSSDIKVPWELSRFQHFNTLGRAYWMSANEKYAREFVNQLLDWIRCNPPRIGINWCCSMEIAIRLINWISAYFFFKDSPSFKNEAKRIFFKYILIQQIFIYYNLEFGYRISINGRSKQVNGNHYIADLLGLIIPSIIFPALSPTYFLRKALHWIYREIKFQVNPDGVHYELSIGYHRLMTEMFLLLAIIILKNDRKLPQLAADKIQKMLEFVIAYTKPDGLAPQVRDADNGRLLAFTQNPINDHRYLLNIGAVLFNRPDFKTAVPSVSHEALWWLGPNGFEKFGKMQETNFKQTSKAFSGSGFFFMRKDDDYLLGLCAGAGMGGHGAHSHNDTLSFELFSNGKSILIDPGTYVYSSDPRLRNLFRSTAYHNTVRVDGNEINEMDPKRLFYLPEEANLKIERWVSNECYDILIANHSGYKKLNEEVIHRRTFFFNKIKRSWKIVDQLFGEQSHLVEILLHFGLGIMPDQEKGKRSIVVRDKSDLHFTLKMHSAIEWDITLKKEWISPSYGVKYIGWTASYSKVTKLPIKTSLIIKSAS